MDFFKVTSKSTYVFELVTVFFRIHTLEEQLKDMEVKSDERVNDERRKYQDMIVSCTVQSPYNTPYSNMNLDITQSYCSYQIFLPWNFTKGIIGK